MSTAFALRAEYEGTVPQDVDGVTVDVPAFTGGVIAVAGREQAFDVREALEAGAGVIVVADSDPALALALSEYPPLKRVEVPDDAEAVDQYAGMTVADLRAEAQRRGLEGYGRAVKDALITALRAHDARLAAGDSTAAPSDTNPVTVGELADPDAGDAGQEA